MTSDVGGAVNWVFCSNFDAGSTCVTLALQAPRSLDTTIASTASGMMSFSSSIQQPSGPLLVHMLPHSNSQGHRTLLFALLAMLRDDICTSQWKHAACFA
jgi:hypothetical protein